MKKGKRTSQLIGVIGGGIGLLFAIILGPLYSAPLHSGASGLIYWGFLIILATIVVIIGGVFAQKTYYFGSSLMIIGGICNLIGYGLSPASIFGILFIYGGIRGVGEPKQNE